MVAMQICRIILLSLSPLAVMAYDSYTPFEAARTVLETKCVECHTPEKAKGDLDFTTREAMIRGGESGSALKPGEPEQSELVRRLRLPADDSDRMPPKKHGEPLAPEEIKALADWISAGAPWPEGEILSPRLQTSLPRWDAPPNERIVSIEAFPKKVTLETAADFHRVIVIARFKDTEMWVMKWAELMQIRTFNNGPQQVSYKAALNYYQWLRERVAGNMPFNELVKELLSAEGGTFSSPATNFFQIEQDVLKLTENVAQVFMGTRIQCAQCHNHPFDRWTMDDYYGFASFFAQVKRKPAEDPRERIIYDQNGELQNPVTKQNMVPKFLGGPQPDLKKQSRRESVAHWLASPKNPWFAKNVVNIVWAHFNGVEIVEPVDDVRVSNPPSNPELLDALAEKFVSYNYDFKKLVRDICTSRTYQLSTRTNETNITDERNFSHAMIRRVRAEVLLDAISQVTGTPNKFKGLPLGARAVQIADGNTSNYFLSTFGRATRATVCSCEVKMEPNLSQALHLLNGDTTQERIRQGKRVETLLNEKKSPEEVISNLYLTVLSRQPTDLEKEKLMAAVEGQKEPAQVREMLEDIFWALLNSKEFIFNH